MKHVIVTGGSRGLGLSLVEALLRDGNRVSTCSRKDSAGLAELRAAHGAQLFWRSADVGAATAAQDFVEAAMAATELPLYGLINNAGIAAEGVLATFPNIDSEEVLRVNLGGALQMAREASRILLSQNSGGRIINISSIVAGRGYTGFSAYAASKSGLEGMTRSLARELGRRAITVNAIAPGFLETDMSASLAGPQRQQIVRRTPLGRLGQGSDVVGPMLFLLSDAAAFVTGQVLVVDGGLSC